MPLVIEEPATTVEIEEPDKVVIVEPALNPTVVLVDQGIPGPKGDEGEQGIQGIQGKQGDPGAAGDVAYIHNQDAPSDTWVIVHNLGRRIAAITVYDSAETIMHGQVVYNNPNQVTVYFSSPFSGRAEVI